MQQEFQKKQTWWSKNLLVVSTAATQKSKDQKTDSEFLLWPRWTMEDMEAKMSSTVNSIQHTMHRI